MTPASVWMRAHKTFSNSRAHNVSMAEIFIDGSQSVSVCGLVWRPSRSLNDPRGFPCALDRSLKKSHSTHVSLFVTVVLSKSAGHGGEASAPPSREISQ